MFLPNNNSVIKNNTFQGKENSNSITMMYETDVDSHEYQVTTDTLWPEDGYVFNATLSSCKNGSELIWNEEDRSILLRTSVTDSCNVYFDKYAYPVITRVTTSDITTNSITLTVEVTAGESSIATYYYSNNDGESYEESESNTYTFSSLSNGTEYNFKVYAVDLNGKSSEVYSLQETTEDTIYIADYIKNEVYTGDGNGGLYLHDGVGTYTNANQETGDNSYRYAGANPNNYVCFASDAETCPNDNLYRIIGVFGDQVKLIKRDYANSNMLGTNGDYYGNYGSLGSYYKGSHSAVNAYYWNNSTRVNTWSQSNLNTVNLNTNYINYLNNQNSKWAEMIETTNWQVGGNSYQNIQNVTVKNTYTNEIVSPAANTTYSAKIGLMYVSDYGYAASPANWTTNLVSYDNNTNRNNNWMFMGLYEWTISRSSDNLYYAFHVSYTGYVSSNFVYYVNIVYGVRPSFYLKSNVAITSGDGTSSNPYRLSYAG